jgi:predicted outer membrane repeat protein
MIGRVVILAAVIGCWALLPANAAGHTVTARDYTFNVTSTADAHDAYQGEPVCATRTRTCTLRAAVEAASALAAGAVVTVHVPAGIYDLTLGSLDAGANVIILDGASAASTVISARSASRVLKVAPAASVTIDRLTLTRGNAGGGVGGAVLNDGQLLVVRSDFRDDSADSGGALSNAGGVMRIEDSDFADDNDDSGDGGGAIQNGGIADLPGSVSVTGSTFSHDQAGADGGAILNGQNGQPPGPDARASRSPHVQAITSSSRTLRLTVAGSTFSSDESSNEGGAIANDGGAAILSGDVFSDDTAIAGALGGAISSYGTLVLTRSRLSNNSACYGGAIELESAGTTSSATIGQSTFSGNKASCYGGAIDVSGTSVTLTQSTLVGNWSTGGAAVEIEGSSSGTFTNSTFYRNTGSSAIQTFECGQAELSFDTFSANTAALDLSCPDSTVLGTILASSAEANCRGAAPVSRGYNLDTGSSCRLTKPTDFTDAWPDLGELSSNGGPTQTMALLPGSRALGHGGTRATGCPPVDQRGVRRPQAAACDIGAFEKTRVISASTI